jgi:hypothetical protein
MKPSRRALAAAFCGYVLVALAATWPLALHLFTHLPGPRTGDTGVYAWNLWVFRREVVDLGRWPFSTSAILSLSPPADLSLHNYTLVANILALPLLPTAGIVGTYNLILLLFLALDGWCLFLLARHVTGRTFESWVAGAMFAASPVLIARTTAHLSLVAAFPLPLAALAAIRLLGTWRARDAVATGAAVALAAACDAYYGVYAGLLLVGLAVGCRFRLVWERRKAPGIAVTRAVAGALALVLLVVAGVAATGGFRVEVLGTRIVAETLYTPVLVATLLGVLLTLLVWRPRPVALGCPLLVRDAARPLGAVVLTAAVLLSPVLAAAGRRAAAGELDLPATHWRSSAPGVDLLAFAMPNPNHPWFGAPFRAWLARERADGFPEYVAALPLTMLAVIAFAFRRRPGAVPRPWPALTVVFALLALGPFIHVAGTNTFVPGPWALLRYVPIVGLARSPARFAMVVAMLASVAFAFAFSALRDRAPHRRLVTVLVLLVAGAELLPAPRPLRAATVPAIYHRIAADPDPRIRVLELPTGVRDGASSIGNFSARSQFFQTVHGKRLIGGYLSRVPRRQKRALSRLPVLSALVALSEGRPLTPEAEYEAWRARHRFIARARLGYVVIDTSRASRALRDFAIELLDLELVAEDMGFELYRPRRRALQPSDPPFRWSAWAGGRVLPPGTRAPER